MSKPTMRTAFDDALSTARFVFTVDKHEIGRFTEVSGLSVEVHVETVEEGGENGFVHKLPGRMSWPNLVLKGGMTDTDNLFRWLAESSGDGFTGKGNTLTRRTAAVTLLALDGEHLRTWSIRGAFAVKWTGPTFDVGSNSAVVEQLEVAHHGFSPSDP